MSHLARGVVLLINKKDPIGFTEQDTKKLELFSQILGRCHYIIEKIEQFYSLIDTTQRLVKVSNLVSSSLDSSTVYYGAMKNEIEVFLKTMGDRHGALEDAIPNFRLKSPPSRSGAGSRSPSPGIKGNQKRHA